MKKPSVGLIGFGRFGRLTYNCLAEHTAMVVHDERPSVLRGCPHRGTLEAAVAADFILLCVPISAIRRLCRQVAPLIRPQQLIIDTCSVKESPLASMVELLPASAAILGTHPLFGPDSAQGGIAGLKIVLCPVRVPETLYRSVRSFLEDLGLVSIEASPEEHDRQIAQSQAVFHLIAQALGRLGWAGSAISTPGPDAFYRLVGSVQNDTEQLFLDLERENRFAASCRDRFLGALLEINAILKENSSNQE